MKSIRRTMILGMVLLLCFALGAISILIYRSSRDAIDDKNMAIRNLYEHQFESKRDAALLAEVRTLVSLADVGLRPDRVENAVVLVATEIQVHEEKLTHNSPDEISHEFLQITTNSRTWKSQTLRDENGSLVPPAASPAAYEHVVFDSSIRERPLRVITYNVPLQHYNIDQRRLSNSLLNRETVYILGGALILDSFYPPRNALPDPRRQPPQPRWERTTPMAVVQIGWDAVEHPTIQKLRSEYESQVAELERDTISSLARLRLSFYAIGLATLIAAVLGGGMVVTRSLKPLRSLSNAVSHVSEKDFALPLEAQSMPVELRPTVEKLKDTLQMLRQAFEREKQATADISHELRTPIASLNATLDVALKKQRTAVEYRDVLVDCRAIGKEMGGLVERIMSLAYLDAGQVHMKDEAVNANDLLGVCAAISKPLAEAQGLHFRMNLQSDIHLRTDPDKLREVVMNLLHNAIEYNRPGGEVEMNARTWGQNGLEVDIRDTGIGIGADIRDKIFERFYRGDPSRANTGVHAGLGLSIVREYITRLGGTLELESQVGRGSQFKIRVPNR